jgi:putative nucleotidyltransferase with HDIG domain
MNSKKILLFEENSGRQELIGRLLKALAVDVVMPSSFSEAARLLQEDKNDWLFVAGFRTLSNSHIHILERFKKSQPRLSIIVLSPSQSPDRAFRLLRSGIVDYFAGPDHFPGILSAVKSALNKNELLAQNEMYLKSLRRLKIEQAKNLKKALELEEIYDSTVENLMMALDLRDVETFGHSKTVAKYSQVLAKLMGIEAQTLLDNIRKGALLHDIGKIAIPDAILKKSGSLSLDEWEKIKLHPSLGYGLIKEIKLVKEVGNIILFHHERYNGTGYPRGLKKEKIPLEARIFALADALDAITAHRPYRKVRDFRAAQKEIIDHSGTQFDPRAVNAFCSLKLEKWEKIRFETTSYIPNIEEFSELINKVKK